MSFEEVRLHTYLGINYMRQTVWEDHQKIFLNSLILGSFDQALVS